MEETADQYLIDDQGRFVIHDYNRTPPFSSFLPGIGGHWGIPLWVFYVNRGQVIAGFGARDKNGQIMEFQSFNLACHRIRTEGFRTFLRLEDGTFLEPFRPAGGAPQTMLLSAGEVELVERSDPAGLQIEVSYHPLVNAPVAGLVRRLAVGNVSDRSLRIEGLDGMARILPFGMTSHHVKHTARHIEAMMGAEVEQGRALFSLDQTAEDREQIEELAGTHFYLGGDGEPLVDPALVFGDAFDLEAPIGFIRRGLEGLRGLRQQIEGRTPCAFAGFEWELAPGERASISTIIGYAPGAGLLERWIEEVGSDRLEQKRSESRQLLDRIQDTAFTASGDVRFDLYCRQTFLDNVLRGGLPHFFEGGGGQPFYVFFRQNGDLERDYHHFVLEPTYFSQGTGHYRSILQNRRTDVWFFPRIGDFNLRMFLDLTQTDGYNPLVVEGLRYRLPEEPRRDLVPERIRPHIDPDGFTPGELAMALDEDGLGRSEIEPIIGRILAASEPLEVGGLHEGFWIDHWAYNLDTLEVYAMVFPDRLADSLLAGGYTFFDNPDVVLPVADKCVLRPDGAIRRYGAVIRDTEKECSIASRSSRPHTVRTEQGEVYQTTLVVKLLCLIANRLATFDPDGLGIEMEADKPGWNDSLNGLPALFGSSLCETFELHRACRLLRDALPALGVTGLDVYEELADFLDELRRLLGEGEALDPLSYWRRSNRLKERYRERTRLGVTGRERSMSVDELTDLLESSLRKLEQVVTDPRILSPEGVPYTYFTYEVVEYRKTGRTGHQGYELVEPTEFRRRPAPLFLEGPVHRLRLPDDLGDPGGTYRAVRRSALVDEELAMYKSSERVPPDAYEFGRAIGAYPRGWIENESVYVHMEYKYLLELLRSGLHEEFWRDGRTALIPFMAPERYGRNVLEGVSFIVSSAHPDPTLHGRGYQPRLSGVTAEMLNMWMLIVAGDRPFEIDPREGLRLTLRPVLPGWLFTAEERRISLTDRDGMREEVVLEPGSFAFRLLGETLVVYANPERRPTYGDSPVQAARYVTTDLAGRQETVNGPHLPHPLAEAVRAGGITRIDVRLA